MIILPVSASAVGLLNISSILDLPVDITIESVAANLGQNGTTFYSFAQGFSNLTISNGGSANSGSISGVTLPQGPVGTLAFLAKESVVLDVISANVTLQ